MGGCALIAPVYLEIALFSGAKGGAIKARCKLHRAKNGQTKTTVRVHRGLGDDFGCQIQNFIVQGF